MKKITFQPLALVCCICLSFPVLSQQSHEDGYPYSIWLDPVTDDFSVIQQEAEAYFADKRDIRGSGYKQWKRWEYLMMDRLTGDRKLTNYNARNMKAHQLYSKLEHQNTDQRTHGGFWFPVATDGYVLDGDGYNPGIGRVNCIAFHPSNQSIIYAGTPAGGLWRTTNEGSSWTPLTDGIPRIGVSGIAIHPTNPDIIYILTGDGDKSDVQSIGVLKSTNGGLTWNTTGLVFNETDFVRGFKLVMKPGEPNVLFAVMSNGLWRSENSGDDWTMQIAGNFRDIEFRPGTPDTIYACTLFNFVRSFNGGDDFTIITTGLPTGENRSAIAVTAANPNFVYYLAGPGGPTAGTFNGLYRSSNNGTSFSTLSTTPNILDNSTTGNASCTNGCDQASVDLAMAIDPNDADEIITGCFNVWRNEDIDLGTPWTLIAHWDLRTPGWEYTHADIHDLVFQDNNRLWCASDGGIFLSTDDGVTWTDKTSVGTNNGLICTQFYKIAGTPNNSSLLLGGTQDNGSNIWAGGNDIIHFNGGDGMDCAIDFTNDLIQYSTQQNGRLFKSADGGLSVNMITPGNSGGGWVSPLAMDPSNEQEIWLGMNDTIYRSTNGGTSWTGYIPLPGAGNYRHIWCAPSDDSIVYAATATVIFRNTLNGSGAWTNITGNLPVASTNITGLTTDVNNANNIWVTMSGYVDGQKVYYNNNGGSSWTNISGSLPNIAMNCVIYDDAEVNDNAVYVGTDIGIFYRDATLSDWLPFRNGLPNTIVMDMHVDVAGNKLYAGTYGRGIWSSNLYSECPASWFLTNANAPGTYPEGYTYYQASNSIQSTRDFYGGTGTKAFYKAGNTVTLNPGFRARSLELFKAWIGPCEGGIPDSLGGIESGETTARARPQEVDCYATESASQSDAYPEDFFEAAVDYDNSAIYVASGNARIAKIDLLKDKETIQSLYTGLQLYPGNNRIPFPGEMLGDGQYQVKIVIDETINLLDVTIGR